MTGKLQTVHVRVTDAATGKPTPCRVRFTDADANHYPPLGRYAAFPTGPNEHVGAGVLVSMKPHAYVDGGFEIQLPPTLLRVEIEKGPEYLPIRTEVQLAPGKLSLRFKLTRWADWREKGWYSGDTCVLFTPPHAALLEGRAEDVAVVNLLAAETDLPAAYNQSHAAAPNLVAFSGQGFALAAPGHGVAVNTLNRHPELGSLGLLNSHRAVFPLRFGGPKGQEDWTLADWCDQCHRKGGLVVWTGRKHNNPQMTCGEALADVLLGKVDAFELDAWHDGPDNLLGDYYALLDVGCTLPLVGGSGKNSNASPLGVMRTYAHLEPGQEFGYRAWIEAVRAGRTFATNGPLIALTVDGGEPSRTPLAVEGSRLLRVRAEASSRWPFEQLEVLWNGEVIATAVAICEDTARAAIEIDHPVAESGWLAARCRGSHVISDWPENQRIFAHTSPCFVNLAGRPFVPKEATVRALLDELVHLLDWVQSQARCPTEKHREDLAGVVGAARRELEGKCLAREC